MLFNSIDFLIFFPAVCLVYYLLPGIRSRNTFLVAASYYFYMNWQPVYALLLLSATLISYFTARLITRYPLHSKTLLTVGISLNLSFLIIFKYAAFINSILISLLSAVHLRLPMPEFSLLLPVGISFFTFQTIGYMIDVYRDRHNQTDRFTDYMLFVAFFPQLVAGPIERPSNLLPQFRQYHTFTYDNFIRGVRMMLEGYLLKLVLADRCAIYVDAVFNNYQHHSGASLAVASLLFPWQIYGDFAGYSLIAIGVAKVMGFDLMRNFRRPYLSGSVTEYWRRWHISLSGWLRDYLYIPLGGSRKGKWKTYRNLLITFTISGLWHGADFTYTLWGALHGLVLCIERAFGIAKKEFKGWMKVLAATGSFLLVALLFIIFRADTPSMAIEIYRRIFTDRSPLYLMPADMAVAIAAIVFTFSAELYRENKNFLKNKISIIRPRRIIPRKKSTRKILMREILLRTRLTLLSYTGGYMTSTILDALYVALAISFITLFGVLGGDQFIYFQF